jgi:hypothetical protein
MCSNVRPHCQVNVLTSVPLHRIEETAASTEQKRATAPILRSSCEYRLISHAVRLVAYLP